EELLSGGLRALLLRGFYRGAANRQLDRRQISERCTSRRLGGSQPTGEAWTRTRLRVPSTALLGEAIWQGKFLPHERETSGSGGAMAGKKRGGKIRRRHHRRGKSGKSRFAGGSELCGHAVNRSDERILGVI